VSRFLFCYTVLTLKWKRGAVKNTCYADPREGKWDRWPIPHADFRGTPTSFAVFKMMLSSKHVNQNMLKISYIFWKSLQKFAKFWRFRLHIPVGFRRLGTLPPDPPPPCDFTHTYCTATKRLKWVLNYEGLFVKIKKQCFLRQFWCKICIFS